MTLRFYETEKLNKSWFRDLPIESKVLYHHIHANCDIAGFYEVDLKTITFQVGLVSENDIKGLLDNCKPLYSPIEAALKPLSSLLLRDKNVIWLKDFLFEQKNLPLNPDNNCHKGILARINSHGSLKEQVFIEIEKIQKEQGLSSPLGNSKGNSKGKKGVQGENPDHQVCLVDKERAYGNAFTVRSKNGKNLMFNLCPDCKKIYCELVKSEKIHTGKTSLQEIESLIGKQKAVR